MPAPSCLVFEDAGDWIVFAPSSRLALRTNRLGAERFRGLADEGPRSEAECAPSATEPVFAPTQVTISCTNMCGQRCVYCYGTPAHRNTAVLDVGLCRAAAKLVAGNAASAGQPARAIFHGVGEPTFAWQRFVECVDAVGVAATEAGVRLHRDLCTGGQLDEERAVWIAERFESVQVSIDGPADLQNRQRPRADGSDSLASPRRLARLAHAAGKNVSVKATITAASVGRMAEIVNFVASEIGSVRLDLGMMFGPPWVDPALASPPDVDGYVAGFGEALDRGAATGVRVNHPTISWETLAGGGARRAASHFCLAPPDIVTAFFDVPREGRGEPRLGAYGRWADGIIRFDHTKRARLEADESRLECQGCACRAACLGQGGVKGRIPEEIEILGAICQARVGVLKEMLRRAVPRGERRQEAAV